MVTLTDDPDGTVRYKKDLVARDSANVVVVVVLF